jgi:hypothetical protein
MKTKPPLSVLAAAAVSPIMKAIALFALLACLPCCFGQTDTNLLAAGDWSETVHDGDSALRGRLLVQNDTKANRARVYLELQHLFEGGWSIPVEVYYDIGRCEALHPELRDLLGQPVYRKAASIRMVTPMPYWVTLPCDSTLRLRVDWGTLSPPPEPDSLELHIGWTCWVIRPNATNDFYLSATFTPSKDHPSSTPYHVWHGTLKLPKVKIPVRP